MNCNGPVVLYISLLNRVTCRIVCQTHDNLNIPFSVYHVRRMINPCNSGIQSNETFRDKIFQKSSLLLSRPPSPRSREEKKGEDPCYLSLRRWSLLLVLRRGWFGDWRTPLLLPSSTAGPIVRYCLSRRFVRWRSLRSSKETKPFCSRRSSERNCARTGRSPLRVGGDCVFILSGPVTGRSVLGLVLGTNEKEKVVKESSSRWHPGIHRRSDPVGSSWSGGYWVMDQVCWEGYVKDIGWKIGGIPNQIFVSENRGRDLNIHFNSEPYGEIVSGTIRHGLI